MCWFIDFSVVPQKATLAGRITIPQLAGPDTLHGNDLTFSYYDKHCACETVKKNRIGGLSLAVDEFCDQSAVKRVEVRKYWASAKSAQPRVVSITQSEFRKLCADSGPEEDVQYRISPDRYHES